MALVAALQAATMGVRLWFEWIETNQNPADPLSRDGLADAQVRKHLDTGAWCAYQPSVTWEDVLRTPAELLQRWE